MSKKTDATTAEPKPVSHHREERAEALLKWITQKKNTLLIGAVGIVLVGVIAFSSRAQADRREAFAEGELNQARATINSGNTALAALDLGRVVNDHSGTAAGEEAAILLAKVRLIEGDAALAASELTVFLASGPRRHFRSPAAALLGNAYEELAQFGEASDAYVQAADETEYSLVKAQYLMEAGRTAALNRAPDLAAELFQRVIDENENEAVAQEARLRLGEVRPGGSA